MATHRGGGWEFALTEDRLLSRRTKPSRKPTAAVDSPPRMVGVHARGRLLFQAHKTDATRTSNARSNAFAHIERTKNRTFSGRPPASTAWRTLEEFVKIFPKPSECY